ncbi:putative zinc ribbon protein, partial [Pseudomonas aeruginosa]|uniref:putative zinc ribbon protein n=1 Tax=Pseudomonas aeruginosa TaxID=287 RepID=UPI0031B737C0
VVEHGFGKNAAATVGREHDQMTVAEKILLRCTWLDPAEKEARRLHLQGMTVLDYTVKVRKWFCVMCDEDYEGEKCCPRCGTGVYSRAWGRQEVPSVSQIVGL